MNGGGKDGGIENYIAKHYYLFSKGKNSIIIWINTETHNPSLKLHTARFIRQTSILFLQDWGLMSGLHTC